MCFRSKVTSGSRQAIAARHLGLGAGLAMLPECAGELWPCPICTRIVTLTTREPCDGELVTVLLADGSADHAIA